MKTFFWCLAPAISWLSFMPTDSFKLVRTEKGVSLYERWVTYHEHTVREMKLLFSTRNQEFKKVVYLLKDANKGKVWNHKARDYKVQPTTSEHVWVNYIRYKLPWPMQDQDCCLQFSYDPHMLSADQCVILFKSQNQTSFPVLKNVTRLQGTQGKWVLKRQSSGMQISYQIITNKSSEVPRWISDPLVYDNMVTTISQFRDLLQQNSNIKSYQP